MTLLGIIVSTKFSHYHVLVYYLSSCYVPCLITSEDQEFPFGLDDSQGGYGFLFLSLLSWNGKVAVVVQISNLNASFSVA